MLVNYLRKDILLDIVLLHQDCVIFDSCFLFSWELPIESLFHPLLFWLQPPADPLPPSVSRQLPTWASLSKDPITYQAWKAITKILNLTFTEPFFSHNFNTKLTFMQSLMPLHCFLFEIQIIKNGFTGQ